LAGIARRVKDPEQAMRILIADKIAVNGLPLPRLLCPPEADGTQ
jgi:hypothetical protein